MRDRITGIPIYMTEEPVGDVGCFVLVAVDLFHIIQLVGNNSAAFSKHKRRELHPIFLSVILSQGRFTGANYQAASLAVQTINVGFRAIALP